MSDDKNVKLVVTVPDTAQFRNTIACELRAMAEAKTPYQRFSYLPPRIRAVWHAAATLIESRED